MCVYELWAIKLIKVIKDLLLIPNKNTIVISIYPPVNTCVHVCGQFSIVHQFQKAIKEIRKKSVNGDVFYRVNYASRYLYFLLKETFNFNKIILQTFVFMCVQ